MGIKRTSRSGHIQRSTAALRNAEKLALRNQISGLLKDSRQELSYPTVDDRVRYFLQRYLTRWAGNGLIVDTFFEARELKPIFDVYGKVSPRAFSSPALADRLSLDIGRLLHRETRRSDQGVATLDLPNGLQVSVHCHASVPSLAMGLIEETLHQSLIKILDGIRSNKTRFDINGECYAVFSESAITTSKGRFDITTGCTLTETGRGVEINYLKDSENYNNARKKAFHKLLEAIAKEFSVEITLTNDGREVLLIDGFQVSFINS